MSNEAKNEMPRGIKPVQSVELSESHLKTRWLLVGAFVVIAMIAFGFAINGWLTADAGWIFKKYKHIRNYKACRKGALIGFGVIGAILALFGILLVSALL